MAFASYASAGLTQAQCPWSDQVGTININAWYSFGCAKFTWIHAKNTPDFNNYIVHTTGAISTADFNTTSTEYKFCTIADNETVTIFIQAVDGNAEGRFCSFDINSTATAGNAISGAKYFVYQMFNVMAAIIGILVIVFVTFVFLDALFFHKFIKI